jgi:hypothetical protein
LHGFGAARRQEVAAECLQHLRLFLRDTDDHRQALSFRAIEKLCHQLELAAKIFTDRPGIGKGQLGIGLFHQRFTDQTSFVRPPSINRGFTGLC